LVPRHGLRLVFDLHGEELDPDESIFRLQQGQPENIKESYLIWDRPLQVSLNLNFTVPKDQPLFGVDVLKEMNLFVRVFYESGSGIRPRFSPALMPLRGVRNTSATSTT